MPGNHDVPAKNLLKRFINPYDLYRRYIADDLEPLLDLGDVVVVGIRTSRRLRAELAGRMLVDHFHPPARRRQRL